jgi:hypothetical protein
MHKTTQLPDYTHSGLPSPPSALVRQRTKLTIEKEGRRKIDGKTKPFYIYAMTMP